jgi:hypothetical protein
MPGEETAYKIVDSLAGQEPTDHLICTEEFLYSLILSCVRVTLDGVLDWSSIY